MTWCQLCQCSWYAVPWLCNKFQEESHFLTCKSRVQLPGPEVFQAAFLSVLLTILLDRYICLSEGFEGWCLFLSCCVYVSLRVPEGWHALTIARGKMFIEAQSGLVR